MSVTRIDLVAATFTNINSEFEALGNKVKVLTELTDVSIGVVPSTHTPTALQSITGGTNGPAAIVVKPKGDSREVVWAYSTAGGAIYLHGSANDSVEYIEKGLGVISNPLVGTGISSGGTAFVRESVTRKGMLITTQIVIDMIGLDSSAGTTDIIGEIGAANCWFYKVTTARNGVIYAGSLECLVTPVTGDVDVDLYAADESTGVEDADVTSLTDDRLLANGASMAKADGPDALALFPGPDQHLYLTGAGTTNATYSAGRFLITLFGMASVV